MFEWVIGISIAVVAVAILALVIFLILTLMSLIRSLKRTETLIQHTNEIMVDVEDKIHCFDPYFRLASKFGRSVEKQAAPEKEGVSRTGEAAVLIAEMALMGLALWKRLKN